MALTSNKLPAWTVWAPLAAAAILAAGLGLPSQGWLIMLMRPRSPARCSQRSTMRKWWRTRSANRSARSSWPLR